MRIGDLVRLRTRSLEPSFGPGIVVKDFTKARTGQLGVQVFWSKRGLGNRCSLHSLEVISESKEG